MKQFIVSARKYRPQVFEDVVGQEQVTMTLQNAIKKEQLGQAFLFCGPRGVGKTTCARILAKVINGIDPKTDSQESFNVHELDAASHNSVDDMRSLVDQVRILPQSGKYKVYIIDEVHMLSQAAFNAFLKTLEEPPSYAIFILATTEKHKILPTILSRCQIFDFNRITVADIVGHLEKICQEEGITFEPGSLHIIAQKADGALRDALSIFDRIVSFANGNISMSIVLECLNVLDYDYYFKFVDAFLSEDTSQTMLLFNEALSKGFEGNMVLDGLAEHFRDLLMCRDVETIKILEKPENILESYKNQSQYTSPSFLLTALNIVNDSLQTYKTVLNRRLHTEIALLKLCGIYAFVQMSDIEGEVKKKSKPQSSIVTEPAKKLENTTPPVVEKPKPAEVPEDKVSSSELVPEENKTSSKDIVEETDSNPLPSQEKTNKPRVKKEVFLGNTKVVNFETFKQKEKEAKEEEGLEEEIVRDSIEQDELEKSWKECIEYFEGSEEKVLSILLKNHIPLVENQYLIKVLVANGISRDQLLEKRNMILDKLMGLSGKRGLELEVEIDPKAENQIKQTKPYTAREKFESMKSQNPNIEKLKEDLGLELDV